MRYDRSGSAHTGERKKISRCRPVLLSGKSDDDLNGPVFCTLYLYGDDSCLRMYGLFEIYHRLTFMVLCFYDLPHLWVFSTCTRVFTKQSTQRIEQGNDLCHNPLAVLVGIKDDRPLS